MSTIDVRAQSKVNKIVFAEAKEGTTIIANAVQRFNSMGRDGAIKISDGNEFVVIASQQHADDLIKALQEAGRQGWLK